MYSKLFLKSLTKTADCDLITTHNVQYKQLCCIDKRVLRLWFYMYLKRKTQNIMYKLNLYH